MVTIGIVARVLHLLWWEIMLSTIAASIVLWHRLKLSLRHIHLPVLVKLIVLHHWARLHEVILALVVSFETTD